MTCTLDATAGSATADSYTTATEAATYYSLERLADEDWDAASNDTKCRALKWATRLLDEQIEWKGALATDEQALAWPRTGAYDHLGRAIGSDVIPQRLKNATAELARTLIEEDTTEPLSSEGIKLLRVSSIQVNFSDTNPVQRRVIPESVLQTLAPWIEKNKFAQTGTVRLVRV